MECTICTAVIGLYLCQMSMATSMARDAGSELRPILLACVSADHKLDSFGGDEHYA